MPRLHEPRTSCQLPYRVPYPVPLTPYPGPRPLYPVPCTLYPGSVLSAIQIDRLSHRYGERTALDEVSFSVAPGEIFGLLGPNGSGKTTMFRILSTLMRPTSGRAEIFGVDIGVDPGLARRSFGVVFQRPSVDPKLSVDENLTHHGRLYGMRGSELAQRCREMLDRVGLADRASDRVETLSGGLQRRVELAKGLLHSPRLLLLDEPSTGLDPGARREFNRHLLDLRDRDGVTIVLTTHYMEEAERCDRVGIMDEGRLARVDTPLALKESVGGDVVVVHSEDCAALGEKIRQRFGFDAAEVDGTLRIEQERGHELVRDLVEAFPDEIRTVTFGKPTLEDAFIHVTGRRLWESVEEAA